MAEKPILFNTEMVRAILSGRKKQTRRVIKGLPLQEPHATVDEGDLWIEDEDGKFWRAECFSKIQPGDVLWVRETWAYNRDRYLYKADYPENEVFSWARWHPSIHMPRQAARLFLRVTDVNVERLQSITPKDAYREGTGSLFFEEIAYGGKEYHCGVDDEYGVAREQFAFLWESTIKKGDLPLYGWDANPWVWVISFERIER